MNSVTFELYSFSSFSGLSTALEIKRVAPSVSVVIFSASVSPHTTADGAAGILGLYLMGDTPLEKQVIKW